MSTEQTSLFEKLPNDCLFIVLDPLDRTSLIIFSSTSKANHKCVTKYMEKNPGCFCFGFLRWNSTFVRDFGFDSDHTMTLEINIDLINPNKKEIKKIHGKYDQHLLDFSNSKCYEENEPFCSSHKYWLPKNCLLKFDNWKIMITNSGFGLPDVKEKVLIHNEKETSLEDWQYSLLYKIIRNMKNLATLQGKFGFKAFTKDDEILLLHEK